MNRLFAALIVFSFVTSSCEKDLYYDVQQQSRPETMSVTERPLSELLNQTIFNEAYSKVVNTPNPSILSRTALEDQYGFTISKDVPVKVVKMKDGLVSYTLLLDGASGDSKVFQNLVIQVSDTLTGAALLQYELSGPALNFRPHASCKIDIEKMYMEPLEVEGKVLVTPCAEVTLTLCNNDGTGHSGETHIAGEMCNNQNFLSSVTYGCGGDSGGGYQDPGGGSSGSYTGYTVTTTSPGSVYVPSNHGGSGGSSYGGVITSPVIPKVRKSTVRQNFYDQLNTAQQNWWNQNTVPGQDITDEIIDYLFESGALVYLSEETPDEVAFMLEAITQMSQNPGVFHSIAPFLIEENIDDTQLNPCEQNVLFNIKNTSNCDFAYILAKMGTGNSIYNTTFISEAPPNGAPGQTKWNSPFNYSVYISTNYSGKTKLFIATTLLHELVHAFFLSLFDDFHNSNPTNPDAYNNFAYLFDLYVNKAYPNSQAASIHHQQMATDYAVAIARSLQEYDTGIPVPDTTAPLQIYSDMAFASLADAPAVFDALFPAGNPNRQRILNRYAAESIGNVVGAGTSDEQFPIGQLCN